MTLRHDPFIPPLRDNNFLIDLISEISGKDRAEVLERFKQEHLDLGRNVRTALAAADIRPHVWSDALQRFYSETDAFLYETLVWNRSPLKNDMRRWIGQYLGAKGAASQILTFGDGLGIDAYYLAVLGHDVTYFDVSQPCVTFARRIFEHGNLGVNILTSPEDLQPKSFDVVVCLDVLEHVPEPSNLVGWLSSVLRPGGELIVNAPFHYIDRAVQTHLRANKKYSGDMKKLYRPHCLHMVAGRLFWNPVVLRKYSPDNRPPRRPPLQVRLGSHLLRTGRIWARPHVIVGKMLLGRKALAKMAESQLSHSDSSARTATAAG